MAKIVLVPYRRFATAVARARLPPLPPLQEGSTRLYLARHGETDWNLEKRIQGSTCKPLNAHGVAQAHGLAELLSDAPLELIVTSPLRRAARTAEVIRRFHPNAKWKLEPMLAEMCFGEIEGRTLTEYATTYQETLDAWARGDLDVRWPGAGGESCKDVADRGLAALRALGLDSCISNAPLLATAQVSHLSRPRHVLMMAHSRVNKSLIAMLRGDLRRCSEVAQGNTCLNIVDFDADGSSTLVLLDYCGHVGDSKAWS